MDLPGYALGGYTVGEEPAAMHESVADVAPLLPGDKSALPDGGGDAAGPGHRVAAGVDMFDCVLPTRCARNGLLFTPRASVASATPPTPGTTRPVDALCSCYTCRTFSRAYLRHLFSYPRSCWRCG